MLSTFSPFYQPHCIACRLPQDSCVCLKIDKVSLPFDVMICSHTKEWQRNDNTGQWAYLCSDDIRRFRWQRKLEQQESARSQIELSQQAGNYLLFPSDDAQEIEQVNSPIQQLWLLDGTWQEAQKMLRQSPWLKSMPKVKIANSNQQVISSQFKLRRNQQGLSTMEAIAWAIATRDSNAAESLFNAFDVFQNSLLELKK